jgi:hypothetical protein
LKTVLDWDIAESLATDTNRFQTQCSGEKEDVGAVEWKTWTDGFDAHAVQLETLLKVPNSMSNDS